MPATATRTPRQPGDVLTWDYQSDTFGGQYRLVAKNDDGTWTAEHLAPSEAVIDAILAYAASVEGTGASWMSTLEEVEAEVASRQAEAGSTFRIKLVSSRTYHEMF